MPDALKDQPTSEVQAQEDLIVAFVQEAFPELDLSPGTVLRDIVVRIYGHLDVRLQQELAVAQASNSLLEISKNPDLADATQVDRVLSNFNVSRAAGAKATGKVRLYFTTGDSLVINTNWVITLAGKTFAPSAGFVLLQAANATGAANERILTSSGNLYTCTIDVIAVSSGAAGNIRGGTAISAASYALRNYSFGKADADFAGGSDDDTTADMLAKLKAGVVGKVFGGREHIRAKLKAQFPGVVDCGVVGMLDEEMTRDLVDGVHTGNRVDLYVKTARYPSRVNERLLATLLSYDSVLGGIYEFTLPIDKAAGMYLVESIRSEQAQLGTYEVQSDVRLASSTELHVTPSVSDFTFSSFQTVQIRFLVPPAHMQKYSYSLAPTSTAYFEVQYLRLPDIAEVQNYVDSPAERSLTADMLVKAPVPGLASVSMSISVPGSGITVDLDAVKAAIASRFNAFEMGSRIQASALVNAAYSVLPQGCTIDLPVQMYALIVRPDLTHDVLMSTSELLAPTQPGLAVSRNTVAFFLEASQVDIALRYC